jgi:hypothetical protein
MPTHLQERATHPFGAHTCASLRQRTHPEITNITHAVNTRGGDGSTHPIERHPAHTTLSHTHATYAKAQQRRLIHGQDAPTNSVKRGATHSTCTHLQQFNTHLRTLALANTPSRPNRDVTAHRLWRFTTPRTSLWPSHDPQARAPTLAHLHCLSTFAW